MEIKQIPLSELLNNLQRNQAAHPEFDTAVIRSMACMPIARYLGDYYTFCDFQMIMGIREDLSYQVTACEIADQVRRKVLTPEKLTEAVNILAAPVARIDEAYHRKDFALLPHRKQERSTKAQESLASRLDRACMLAGPPYHLHRMPIDRFFRAVSRLTGNWRYLSVFYDSISLYVSENRDLFRQTIHEITVLDSSDERTDLLYKILVGPFAALPDVESEGI